MIFLEYNVCAPYMYKGRHNENLSEYLVTFDEDLNDFNKLCEFLEYEDAEVPNKRINIYYAKGFDPKKHKQLEEIHNNLHVRLRSSKDIDMASYLSNMDIKFYFEPTAILAANLTVLNDMFTMGASSVYIADDLVYMLDDVSSACYDNGIQLRCVLNTIPSTSAFKSIDPTSVIFRPNDIDMLAQHFDVFEFDCYKHEGKGNIPSDKNYDWFKFDSLYRAYFKDKGWHGDLSEIIEGLQSYTYNPSFADRYFTRKMSCGHKCVLNECNSCVNYADVASKVFNVVTNPEKGNQ